MIWIKFQKFGLIIVCWFFSHNFPQNPLQPPYTQPIHKAHVATSTSSLFWDALPCTVGIPRRVYHLTWCKRWSPYPSYVISDIFFPLCLLHDISSWYTVGSFSLWGEFSRSFWVTVWLTVYLFWSAQFMNLFCKPPCVMFWFIMCSTKQNIVFL